MSSSNSAHKLRRVVFANGAWWLTAPYDDKCLCLNSLIRQCRWKVNRLARTLGLGKRTFTRSVEEGLGITSKRTYDAANRLLIQLKDNQPKALQHAKDVAAKCFPLLPTNLTNNRHTGARSGGFTKSMR